MSNGDSPTSRVKTRGLVILSCGLLTFLLAAPVHALPIIDFEDWTGGEGHQYTVVSHGYDFHGNLYVSPHPETDNPTNCLYSSASAGSKFGLGGLPFSITSLDLQEGFGASDTVSVRLAAYLAGGGDVQQTFVLDGLANTFQTFHPVGFSGIEVVFLYSYNAQGQYSTGGFSVDNIVVPEPAAASLILLGIMGVRMRHSSLS